MKNDYIFIAYDFTENNIRAYKELEEVKKIEKIK